MRTVTITATANYSKKTFTLREQENGKTVNKYRTLPMSQEEFDTEEFNTSNDWKQFLKTEQYILIN